MLTNLIVYTADTVDCPRAFRLVPGMNGIIELDLFKLLAALERAQRALKFRTRLANARKRWFDAAKLDICAAAHTTLEEVQPTHIRMSPISAMNLFSEMAEEGSDRGRHLSASAVANGPETLTGELVFGMKLIVDDSLPDTVLFELVRQE